MKFMPSGGYDANENGTPDVEEDGKYTLAYDGNAINDGDQVAGVPDGGEIKYVSGQVAVLDTEEPTTPWRQPRMTPL